MTLLPFFTLDAYRALRASFLCDRIRAGASYPDAQAEFAALYPAAAAVLAAYA